MNTDDLSMWTGLAACAKGKPMRFDGLWPAGSWWRSGRCHGHLSVVSPGQVQQPFEVIEPKQTRVTGIQGGRMHILHIGTSGWFYDHWTGPFYPEGLHAAERLAYYAERFSSVEINTSFYRLPGAGIAAQWRDSVPAGFVFSAKASRYITHMKKLKAPHETVPPLLQSIDPLGERLGPVLFQLPPGWRANPVRLESFLGSLDRKHRYVFEFRDPSWFDRNILRLLEKHDAAFCIYDLGGQVSPKWVTTDFVYVRLHGPTAAYQGSYDTRTLTGWAGAISSWNRQGRAVYCYFDNDQHGYAAIDALRLKRMLEKS
jgi:uncharacterized protein YecE (DUF72 family)